MVGYKLIKITCKTPLKIVPVTCTTMCRYYTLYVDKNIDIENVK